MNVKKIAVFASGSGTNAENIASYFHNRDYADISLILTNKPDAPVLERAKKYNIASVVFDRHTFYETDEIVSMLSNSSIDFIVLAGFLWLVPQNILRHFSQRIINIHPALLPKYGGKGMYGRRVHEVIIENGEKESGITIHYVNEEYDKGDIIFQARCPVMLSDTPESLAARVHELEYKHFPEVIDKLIIES